METSCYHGDRGVASALNKGEPMKGRGVSHAFKGKSPRSRRTQLWKKELGREISVSYTGNESISSCT